MSTLLRRLRTSGRGLFQHLSSHPSPHFPSYSAYECLYHIHSRYLSRTASHGAAAVASTPLPPSAPTGPCPTRAPRLDLPSLSRPALSSSLKPSNRFNHRLPSLSFSSFSSSSFPTSSWPSSTSPHPTDDVPHQTISIPERSLDQIHLTGIQVSSEFDSCPCCISRPCAGQPDAGTSTPGPTNPTTCTLSPRDSRPPSNPLPSAVESALISQLFGRHGVLEEERTLGQVFEVDCTLHAELSRACCTDNVADTINYAQVMKIIDSVFQGKNRTTPRFYRGASVSFPDK